MAKRRSLRLQLSLAFAGVALLAVGLLAAGLLGMLATYYADTQSAFFALAGHRVLDEPTPRLSGEALRWWTLRAAIAAQSRVRVYDGAGKLLQDSGSPTTLDPSMLATGVAAGSREPQLPRLEPPGTGLFGGLIKNEPPSGEYRLPLPASAGISGGTVLLSEPPTPGNGVVAGVARASAIAAIFAMLLAGAAGFGLATRMSRPIRELVVATRQMTEGDLSARAAVTTKNEVAELSEAFNEMAERTEGTITALRRFVADAAHEIGTPLTALQTDLQLAEKAATSPDEQRLVGRAFEQAKRLNEITAGLLRLSRIEGGDGGSAAVVDLRATVASAVDSVASRAEAAGVELRCDLPDAALPVMADAPGLSAIVLNLLDNAVKFTPENGTVTVLVTPDAHDAALEVRDTGRGIPAEDLGSVFDRFYRGHNVAAIPGSGLGLSIVEAAVRSYHGTISVESDCTGTRFLVRIPLA